MRARRAANPEAHKQKDRERWPKRKAQATEYRVANSERINAKRRKAYTANPESIKERNRHSWAKHADGINAKRRAIPPEERAERNARIRADRKANPEKYRAPSRAHRERNRETVNTRQRAFYKANRELYEKHRRKYVARKAGVEHQPYTRREIYERDGGRCRECKKELPFKPHGFQIDHIVPLSLHGPDIPSNVQLMCAKCNRRKWAKLEGQIHLPV